MVDRKLPAYRDEGEEVNVIAGVTLVRRHSLVRHHRDLGVAGLPGRSFGFERVVDELDAFGLRLSPRAHVPMCPPVDMRGRLAEYWLFFRVTRMEVMAVPPWVPATVFLLTAQLPRSVYVEESRMRMRSRMLRPGVPLRHCRNRRCAYWRLRSRKSWQGSPRWPEQLLAARQREQNSQAVEFDGEGRFYRTGCRQVAWCRALSMFVESLADGGVDGKAGG